MPADPCAEGVVALAAAIHAKERSAVAVMRACLERIDALDPDLKAFVSIYPDQALASAQAVEDAILAGRAVGPLAGVPVAVKDLFKVDGMRRTCGSKFFEDSAEAPEATSVTRLKAAGAIVVGLLNLHEFAFGPTGQNPNTGTARNPWNRDRVAGGSSSGSGVAVAGGLVPATLGSDTGGSIRIPAGLCGVVGLKQSYGLASRHGIFPVSARLDHGGPMTRSAADTALILQAIAGTDPADRSTRHAPLLDYSRGLDGGLSGLRIGVPRGFFFDDLHPEIDQAIADALAVIEDQGATVTDIDLPFAAHASEVWNLLALAEAYAVHEQMLADHGDAYSPDVRERMGLGVKYTARDFVRAQGQAAEINRQMAAVMTQVDLLATPTAPIPAPFIDSGALDYDGQTIDGHKALGRFTRLAALTGQPALSLPAGRTRDGLPIGLQLIGDWFRDDRLLAAAAGFERATPWHQQRPPDPA